jgi:general secretion pathway protein D
VEVSNLNGSVTTSSGQAQPVISTRTISSTIRLKDGETNFLAGLIRRDKQNGTSGVPFLSDIPIVGRLFSDKTHGEQSTDLVMTITPHIIRVPDVTERDLMPIFVGTENNVSYQGAPRVESVNDNRSPFETEQNRRRNQQRPVPPTNAPKPQQPGINLTPPAFPSSPFSNPNPFNNPPVTPPPPQSRNDLGPGGVPATAASADPAAASATAPTEASAAIVAGAQFSFDPPALALSPGQDQTVLLYASGADELAPSKVAVDFDPSVLQVTKVEPLTGGAVEPVSANRVAFTLPSGGGGISGPRAVARLTVHGVAAGSASLSVDATAMTLSTGGPAIVSTSPAAIEVK